MRFRYFLFTLLGACCLVASDCGAGLAVRQVFREPCLARENVSAVASAPIDGAAWIGHPSDMDRTTVAVRPVFLKFRRDFTSDGTPLTLDVSADERFTLVLDGETILRGPDRGSPLNWTYKTVEIDLTPGGHRLEAVVWRLGEAGPVAQLSWRGGFILRASGAYDDQLTTGRAAWQVGRLDGLDFRSSQMAGTWGMGQNAWLSGTWLTEREPTRWEKPVTVRGAVTDWQGWRYGCRLPGWILYPTQLPLQRETVSSPGAFRAVGSFFGTNAVFAASDASDTRIAGLNALLRKGQAFVVPPRTAFRAAWDLGEYRCAYPLLRVAGGKGAEIRWGWAESARGPDGRKRNRTEIVGKYLEPFADGFRPDGTTNCLFSTPWFRAGRWCALEVRTGEKPLELRALALSETGYPLDQESSFACDDPFFAKLQDLCVRGLRRCCHEMLFDCPFFEQQMYPGDARVQMQVLPAVTRDGRMIRRALEIFDFNRRENGLVPMNYPSRAEQDSATYTMCWILALGDSANRFGDSPWLRARLPGLRLALSELERHAGADGLVDRLPGWSFVDWVGTWERGVAPGGASGGHDSSVINLQYALALKAAATVERVCGETAFATRWEQAAKRTGTAVARRFWDERRGLVADTPDMKTFSEHAQCLALLGDFLPSDRAERVFAGLVDGKGLSRCSVYFSYYLFETYFKFGRGDLFLEKLDLWRGYAALGLTTPLEEPETEARESRSDCHAWGAHPVHFLHAGLAGVTPLEPGFGRVRVAPSPGGLKRLTAKTPHPRGFVHTDLRFADGAAVGSVTLPDGVTGVFVWKGRTLPLQSGRNAIDTRSSRVALDDFRVGFELGFAGGAAVTERDFTLQSVRTNGVCSAVWTGTNGTVRATFRAAAGGWRYSGFTVEGAGRDLAYVTFPDVEVPRTGDARLLYSCANPSQGFIRRPDWAALKPGQSILMSEPVGFRFVSVLNGDGVSYYADNRDTRFRRCFNILRNGDAPGTARISTVWECPRTPSNRTRLEQPWDGILATFRGDWYEAAMIYKPWARAQFWARNAERRRAERPLKSREIGFWFWNRGLAEDVMAPVERFRRDAGVPVALDWYWWHHNPYDSGYPNYWPPREGEDAFGRAVRRMNDAGIRTQVYMNGLTWDRDDPSWEPDGAACALVNENGEPKSQAFNVYDRHRLAWMCTEAQPFRDRIARQVGKLEKAGLPGVYLDMISCGLNPGPCFNPKHRHAPGGVDGYVEGYREWLLSLKAKHPKMEFSSEEVSEGYLDVFDSFISLFASWERVGWLPAYPEGEVVPVFNALYHGLATVFGSYASIDGIPPWDPEWPDADRWTEERDWKALFPDQFAIELARTVVWGMQPTVHNFRLSAADDPRLADDYRFMVDTAKFYHANREFLYDGEMLAPGAFLCDRADVKFLCRGIYAKKGEYRTLVSRGLSTVLHSVWRAPDGRVAAILVNWTDASRDWRLDASSESLSGTLPPRTWRAVVLSDKPQKEVSK